MQTKIDWPEVRNKIEQGWGQGAYHDEWFGFHYYCILGAISHTARPDDPQQWLIDQDNEVVPFELSVTFDRTAPVRSNVGFAQRLMAWNDNPYRTKQQVLDFIDEVIENANRI